MNKFPNKLIFPGSVVYQEVHGVAEQIERNEAQTSSVEREMAENTINDTTVSYCRAGMPCDNVEQEAVLICSDVAMLMLSLIHI